MFKKYNQLASNDTKIIVTYMVVGVFEEKDFSYVLIIDHQADSILIIIVCHI